MILNRPQIIQSQFVYFGLISPRVANLGEGGEDGEAEEDSEAEEDYGVETDPDCVHCVVFVGVW